MSKSKNLHAKNLIIIIITITITITLTITIVIVIVIVIVIAIAIVIVIVIVIVNFIVIVIIIVTVPANFKRLLVIAYLLILLSKSGIAPLKATATSWIEWTNSCRNMPSRNQGS